MDLSFEILHDAVAARLPRYRNSKGELVYKDGIDTWTLSQWMNALTGEVGEVANIFKKIDRGDLTLEEVREDIGKELGDIMTYLMFVSMRARINLGEVTVRKFNEVSERIDCRVFIEIVAGNYKVLDI